MHGPEPVAGPAGPAQTPAGGGDVLSAAQCAAWRSDGALFVTDLLPSTLSTGIAEAVSGVPGRSGARRAFPHAKRIALCNGAALEPRLLRAAAQLLGVQDDAQLRLTQGVLRADFANTEGGAADAGMHRDFEENSLVVLASEPDAVHVILFFDDVAQSGGATSYLTPAGEERTAAHASGSALLIKMDTFYRQGAVAPAGTEATAANPQVAIDAAMEAARDQVLGGLMQVMEAHDLPLGILDTLLSEVESAIEAPDDIVKSARDPR